MKKAYITKQKRTNIVRALFTDDELKKFKQIASESKAKCLGPFLRKLALREYHDYYETEGAQETDKK